MVPWVVVNVVVGVGRVLLRRGDGSGGGMVMVAVVMVEVTQVRRA